MVGAIRKSTGRAIIVATALLVLAALVGFAGLPAASAAQDRGRDSRGELCADAARITFRALSHLDATLADLVEDGTLTQEQADIVTASLTGGGPDAVTASETATGPAARCAGIAQSVQATMETLSVLLGLEWTEIRERIQSGESLAEIAESSGVSRDELIAALLAPVTERLDDLEEAGRLTAEERAEREDAALARIERQIDRHGAGETESGSGDATPESDSE